MRSAFLHGTHPRAQGVSRSLLLAVALLLGSTPVHADSCHNVHGSASLKPVPAPHCPSPVGICGMGIFTGGLRGGYTSELFTLTPTADTDVTEVELFTAVTTMPAAHVGRWRGQLVLKEAGAFHVAGAGEFSELYSAAGGTGDFVGATGVLRAVGTFVDGIGGSIDYEGQICVP
jgi:hypothetical protein